MPHPTTPDDCRRVLLCTTNAALIDLAGLLASKSELDSFTLTTVPDAAAATALINRSIDQVSPFALLIQDCTIPDSYATTRMFTETNSDASILIIGNEDNATQILQDMGDTDALLLLSPPIDQMSLKQSISALLIRRNSAVSIRNNIAALEATIARRTKDLNAKVTELNDSLVVLKETQERMVQSNKLTALGEMAGGVAHEINTPLATISLACEQLRDIISKDPIQAESAVKMAEAIKKTTQRIAKIVSGLRLFSREASTDPLQSELVSKVLEDTLSFCSSRFKSERIELTIQAPSEPLQILCRPVQATQVLLNLLNNARDAIQDLPTKWIQILVTQTEKHVEIQISDSGPGIPTAVRAKMFQPFFTTKPIGKGTGLGLSVSKAIIESQGGTLALDPDPQMTKFKVHFCIPNSI